MASVPDSAADARWNRLQELFSRALDLPGDQRESFIKQECSDDAALAQEVLELIACDIGTSTGPLTNAMGSAIDDTTRQRRGALVGKKIGPYRVTAVLGHGGTGTVYLAERADEQYSGKVAIKIVDGAAVHPELGMRFRAERQILANLNHVNIARLIDAGETDDARPYLVMEYVEGNTADVYCDQQRLSINERLELFLQVCAAVQYAHQNLVVHRDLKPANVLVTRAGVPKLLDFGIAKLLDSGNAAAALALTRMNDRLLTPEYAAPEQILGQSVTTASDVYALGAVMYELLTGMRPFVVPASTTQLELERLVCINDPLRPSATIKRAMEDSDVEQHRKVDEIAAARDLSAERLGRRLTGDLDAICMRALRKEPQHRYGSVEQFADDIRRYLADEPVAARQGTWFYYSQRFVRRHTFAVSAAAVFVVFIIAFAIIMALQAQRIAAERDRATQEGARAETVSNFMLDVFGAADPFVSQGREITARELLDQAAQRINGDLARQPEVKARLLETIGQAYYRQGQFARAVRYLQDAVRLRATLKEPNQVSVETLILLATAQQGDGQFVAAEQTFREAQSLAERDGLQQTLTYAKLLNARGRFIGERGDPAGAETCFVQAAALIRELKGNLNPELAEVLLELASLYQWKDDLKAAETALREAVKINRASLPELHPNRVLGENQLAGLLIRLGHNDQADEILTHVLAARRKLSGNTNNSDVADTLQALASVREARGRFAEAEQLAREALEMQERSLGPEHFATAYQHTSLAILLIERDDFSSAEQEARTALRIYGKTLSADHPYIASAEQVLGEALIGQHRYADAKNVLSAARDRWRRNDASAWRIARTTSALGEALYGLGRIAEAEPLLLQGYQTIAKDPSAGSTTLERARERLVRFYRETGQSQKIQSALQPQKTPSTSAVHH